MVVHGQIQTRSDQDRDKCNKYYTLRTLVMASLQSRVSRLFPSTLAAASAHHAGGESNNQGNHVISFLFCPFYHSSEKLTKVSAVAIQVHTQALSRAASIIHTKAKRALSNKRTHSRENRDYESLEEPISRWQAGPESNSAGDTITRKRLTLETNSISANLKAIPRQPKRTETGAQASQTSRPASRTRRRSPIEASPPPPPPPPPPRRPPWRVRGRRRSSASRPWGDREEDGYSPEHPITRDGRCREGIKVGTWIFRSAEGIKRGPRLFGGRGFSVEMESEGGKEKREAGESGDFYRPKQNKKSGDLRVRPRGTCWGFTCPAQDDDSEVKQRCLGEYMRQFRKQSLLLLAVSGKI
ncbi:hypothetical protein EUGRSUZ_B03026 [Eucalyptus grandis]|uniref:Uncharacterized protein n=2 Tax=Eucalyptus grandis TaxID=71139 RepID=A0ACC3LUT6_EUCGR|nr:hypothetical protein EUGRSUZ_B03026 [Eucalyptus grandis]